MSEPATPPPAAAPPPVAPAGRPLDRRRVRRRRWAVAVVVLALFAFDLSRPPAAQLTARAELAAIAVYQATLSRLFGATGVQCRFRPTCSRFAEGAIAEDGALVGTARAVGRILRCGPWTPAGTVDPP